MGYQLYILRLRDGGLYIGSTSDLNRRLKEHERGSGSQTTQKRPMAELIYEETFRSKTAAAKRERQIKRWTRAKKEALILGNRNKLKNLSKSGKAKSGTGFRNLGPVSMNWLRNAGITTFGQLHSLGSLEIYERIKVREPRATLNLLYALEACIQGIPWTSLSALKRARLKDEVERRNIL